MTNNGHHLHKSIQEAEKTPIDLSNITQNFKALQIYNEAN